ncbi:hypothetical protein Ancab_023473 [Ancistrocladus abbreviatus]
MSVLKLSTLIPVPIPISTSKSQKFDKLMRTLASPSPSFATFITYSATADPSIALPATTIPHSSSILSSNSNNRPLFFKLRRRTMLLAPCAQLGTEAHVRTPKIKLTFPFLVNNKNRNRSLYWFLPYSSSVSEERGGRKSPDKVSSAASDSPSASEAVSAAALVTTTDNMGHESNGNDVVWYEKDVLHSSSKKHCEQESSENGRSKLLTLPTILTLCRVAAVPIFVGTFYIDSWWGRAATTSIFIAAAVTDWLDGYLARKMHLGTPFGAFLDPVADKLMVAATLVLLCSRPMEAAMFGDVPWLFPVPAIAIIGREITMSAVREWAASQNSKLIEAVAVNNLGKWKTATQMTALTILLAARENSEGILVGSGVVLLYVSAGLAVWSLVVYMSKIWKVLLR